MRHIIYILIFISLLSCNKEKAGCFTPTGDVKKEVRNMGAFTEMELYDNIEVILTQGTENKIVVEAGENLIPGISTEITNGKLIVENLNTCNFTRTYKVPIIVHITYTDLNHLTHYGGGKVSNTDTLRQPIFGFEQWNSSGDFNLTVDIDTLSFGFHTGSGNANVYGNAKQLSLYSAGYSIFRCGELLAETVYINNSSTGDFTVNVNTALYVQIYNYGNVYYTGNPPLIDLSRSGEGQLIPY